MAVPLPIAAPDIELSRALEDAEPEAILVDPELIGRIEAAAAALGIAVLSTREIVSLDASYEAVPTVVEGS